MNSLTLLHIPHSATWIPSGELGSFLLPGNELREIEYQMTDWYTDVLYPAKKYEAIIARVSRLVVDVERFADDALEPMAKIGQGVIYTHAPDGRELKRISDRERLLREYYDSHHEAFSAAVRRKVNRHGKCLVVDCHSYSSSDLNLKDCNNKPDICIGVDPYHTPKTLVAFALEYIKEAGFSVGINTPFSGTIVPAADYKKDARVFSIMLELNRDLYLEKEPHVFNFDNYVGYSGHRNKYFGQVAGFVEKLIDDLNDFIKDTQG